MCLLVVTMHGYVIREGKPRWGVGVCDRVIYIERNERKREGAN